MYDNATEAWYEILRRILSRGAEVSSRGLLSREILNNTVSFPLVRPVIVDSARKLSYAFMAAEAAWVLAGDDALAPLIAVNSRMVEFSDDGLTLAGAYGKRLVPQLPYILETLLRDPGSRQAVATTWISSPRQSKDIPCTLTWLFLIRDNQLHLRVDMRSSDAWLGIPYDFFTFSVVGLHIYQQLRAHYRDLQPGQLLWSAASSHLYLADVEKTESILAAAPTSIPDFVYDAPVARTDDWLAQSLACTAAKAWDDAPWRIQPRKAI